MMRKNILRLLLVISVLTSAVNSQAQTALDTIVKIEGKIMPVDVTKVTSQYVRFKVPGDKESYTMQRKEIQKIIFKNGRVEEFNKPVVMLIDDYAWEAVWLTEDKKDVLDFHKRGTISAKSAASARSPKAAKKNATIRLQKKAAAMKGNVVLVTKKQATGGYGEFPGYIIEGEVYGFEALPEGEGEGDSAIDGDVVL